MALQNINIGNFVNDGTGDDLRTAFAKINANFDEVDLLQGQNNTASNVGTGAGIFKEKIGVDLRFKSLKAGDGIGLTPSGSEVEITNNQVITVNTDTGALTIAANNPEISILGGTGIVTSVVGNTLTIEGNDYTLQDDTSPTLAGDLDLNGFNIFDNTNNSQISVSTFNGELFGNSTGFHTGNVEGLVYELDVRDINRTLYTFDFGAINNTVTTILSYLAAITIIDMGELTNPAAVGIDFGFIL